MLPSLLTFSLPCDSLTFDKKNYTPSHVLHFSNTFLGDDQNKAWTACMRLVIYIERKEVRNDCLLQKFTWSLTLNIWSHNSSSLYVCFWLMFSLTEYLKKFCLFWYVTSSDLCCSPACMPSTSLTGFTDKVLCKKEILSYQNIWSLCSEMVWIFPPCRIWQQTLTVTSFSLSTRKQVNHHRKQCQTKFKKERFFTLFEREIWSNLSAKHFFFKSSFIKITLNCFQSKTMPLYRKSMDLKATPVSVILWSVLFFSCFWESWCQVSYP